MRIKRVEKNVLLEYFNHEYDIFPQPICFEKNYFNETLYKLNLRIISKISHVHIWIYKMCPTALYLAR